MLNTKTICDIVSSWQNRRDDSDSERTVQVLNVQVCAFFVDDGREISSYLVRFHAKIVSHIRPFETGRKMGNHNGAFNRTKHCRSPHLKNQLKKHSQIRMHHPFWCDVEGKLIWPKHGVLWTHWHLNHCGKVKLNYLVWSSRSSSICRFKKSNLCAECEVKSVVVRVSVWEYVVWGLCACSINLITLYSKLSMFSQTILDDSMAGRLRQPVPEQGHQYREEEKRVVYSAWWLYVWSDEFRDIGCGSDQQESIRR